MNKVNPNDYAALDNAYKVGLIGTIGDDGDPHITLISSLMNKGEDKMMFGEFVSGNSKRFIYENDATGFFIMGLDRNFWTGSMKFTNVVCEGEDYIHYNEMPLFRYNTYCGIAKVHYADLIDISEKRPINMAGVVANALRVTIFKNLVSGDRKKQVLRPWAQEFFAGLTNLMFIGYIGDDGIVKIAPIIQGQTVTSSRVVFTKAPYSDLLTDLKDGARVAIYNMDLDMHSAEAKGVVHKSILGMYTVDFDKVYSPAPPKIGYVYPELKQEAVNWDEEPLVEKLKEQPHP